MKLFSFLLAFIIFNNILAAVTPELIARVSNRDGYNLPTGSSLANVTPALDNQGNIAFNVLFVGMSLDHGAFYYDAKKKSGEVLYRSHDDLFLSDITLYDQKLYFSLFSDGYVEGVLKLDPETSKTKNVLEFDDFATATYLGDLQQTDSGFIFRHSNARSRAILVKKSERDIARTVQRERSGVSYIFSPAISKSGYVAFKRRMGERGQFGEEQEDQVVLYFPTGEKMTIASDKKDQFVSFFNGVGVSSLGHVAFTAKTKNQKVCHYLYFKQVLKPVVCQGERGVQEFEHFAIRVNTNGDIAFRAIQDNGKRAIYRSVDGVLEKVVQEGDMLPTDIAPAKVLHREGWPGFGGNIAFNDLGQLVVGITLVDPEDSNTLVGESFYFFN